MQVVKQNIPMKPVKVQGVGKGGLSDRVLLCLCGETIGWYLDRSWPGRESCPAAERRSERRSERWQLPTLL